MEEVMWLMEDFLSFGAVDNELLLDLLVITIRRWVLGLCHCLLCLPRIVSHSVLLKACKMDILRRMYRCHQSGGCSSRGGVVGGFPVLRRPVRLEAAVGE